MNGRKVIAVIGANGAQGGGLVRAIRNDPKGDFSARAGSIKVAWSVHSVSAFEPLTNILSVCKMESGQSSCGPSTKNSANRSFVLNPVARGL